MRYLVALAFLLITSDTLAQNRPVTWRNDTMRVMRRCNMPYTQRVWLGNSMQTPSNVEVEMYADTSVAKASIYGIQMVTWSGTLQPMNGVGIDVVMQSSQAGRYVVRFVARSAEPLDSGAYTIVLDVPAPVVEVQPPSYHFGDGAIGDRDSVTFKITQRDVIYEPLLLLIEENSPDFRLSEDTFTIENQEPAYLTVYFEPASAGTKSSTITLSAPCYQAFIEVRGDVASSSVELGHSSFIGYPIQREGRWHLPVQLDRTSKIEIDVIDLRGALVSHATYNATQNQLSLQLPALPSGMYGLRITIAGQTVIRKLIVS